MNTNETAKPHMQNLLAITTHTHWQQYFISRKNHSGSSVSAKRLCSLVFAIPSVDRRKPPLLLQNPPSKLSLESNGSWRILRVPSHDGLQSERKSNSQLPVFDRTD
jgi:hypothetical protein